MASGSDDSEYSGLEDEPDTENEVSDILTSQSIKK